MRGASRASFAALTERLAAEKITNPGALGEELFAVVGLLDTEHGLRRALSDPGKPATEKGQIAGALLRGKISRTAEGLVVAAVESRWATPGDMVDAIEQLAIEAMIIAAEGLNGGSQGGRPPGSQQSGGSQGGRPPGSQRGERGQRTQQSTLDDLEDDLFRFGRVVAGQPELRAALADPSLPRDRKQSLLNALLEGKVTAVTLSLINQMVAHPRGRSLNAALDMCASIAARRREQLIAVVRTAVELSAEQRRRLAEALARSYGHRVHLNVVLDPSVVGGISVEIGDELIDGTAASRLAEVRRRLAG